MTGPKNQKKPLHIGAFVTNHLGELGNQKNWESPAEFKILRAFFVYSQSRPRLLSFRLA
jgi:hypothetical protein